MNEFESFKNDIKSVFEKYNYEFDDINVNLETINRNEFKKGAVIQRYGNITIYGKLMEITSIDI